MTYTVEDTFLELGTVTRLTEAINLCVVIVGVMVQAVLTNQSKQIGSV